MEYGVHREQYDALVQVLEAHGVRVRLLPPAEQRSLPTGAEAYDIVILVGEIAGAIVGTAKLVELIRQSLRGGERPRAQRRAKIYLVDGETHEFTLDSDDV
jgi:N-dimethylarginine dimethylaminohydrolase